MNNKTYQSPSTEVHSDSYGQSEWREAKRCTPKCNPSRPSRPPRPIPPEYRIEQERETIIINNSIYADQTAEGRGNGEGRAVERPSGAISRLAWWLLGLSSLLFLGSLILLVGYGRSTNATTKETVNNVTRTREVIRTERTADHDYPPPALW